MTDRAFDPNNRSSTVWEAMFGDDVPPASVDTPEFRDLIASMKRYPHEEGCVLTLIEHINTWADERANAAINQLAASRAMLPVTDSRLTDAQIDAASLDTCTAAEVLGGSMCHIFTREARHKFGRAIERALATPVAIQPQNGMVRYCPHCGLIGEPGEEYRDCCPDGAGAFMVPPKFAEQSRSTFKLAIESVATPVAGWVSVEKDAARYRYLRERKAPASFWPIPSLVTQDWQPTAQELDAAIDAAMSAPPAPVVTPTQQEQTHD